MQSNCGAKRYVFKRLYRIVTAHKIADCKKYIGPVWESYHHRLIHYSTCIRSRVLADFLFQHLFHDLPSDTTIFLVKGGFHDAFTFITLLRLQNDSPSEVLLLCITEVILYHSFFSVSSQHGMRTSLANVTFIPR
jgi:hypothetical protein